MNKKAEQLGVPFGTASGRLRKKILFNLVQQTNQAVCYRCGERIETEADLSIEHKTPWLDSDNPKELFYDLDNIAYSHLSCNSKASRGAKGQIRAQHGTVSRYKRQGCRCDLCREAKRIENKKYLEGTQMVANGFENRGG